MSRTGIGIRTAVERSERITGQIHVYDGAGKGKSQAALGVVLRSIGLGIKSAEASRVLLLRFLKKPGGAPEQVHVIDPVVPEIVHHNARL